MPDIWIDVDTAVSLPVNKTPLVDRTDGVTIEDNTIAYNATGMNLYWNFVTTAGVQTTTAVIPTDGTGVHDWTHVDGGMYRCEIPASAGTVNNDTEGFGWWSGDTSLCLPFSGPVHGFRAGALNNALIDGGDELDVNVTKVADTVQTAADVGDNTQKTRDGIIFGTSVTGTLSTTQSTTDLSGYGIDQLVGRVITWYGGPADGESTDITANTAGGLLTYTAITVAPQNTDPFKIT